MILRIPIVLLLIMYMSNSYAQDRQDYAAPNYELIEKAVNDKGSSTYYPKLLDRFKHNDTTLTAREVHLLYYGQFFQEDMANPFGGSMDLHRDSIVALNAKPSRTDDEERLLMSYYEDNLNTSPFSLRLLRSLYSAAAKLKDPRKVIYDKKLDLLLSTIVATGDGKSESTGWHVATIADEYDILRIFGLKSVSQTHIGHCDYLKLAENNQGVPGIYFDITKITEAEMKMFQGTLTLPDDLKNKRPESKKKKK